MLYLPFFIFFSVYICIMCQYVKVFKTFYNLKKEVIKYFNG